MSCGLRCLRSTSRSRGRRRCLMASSAFQDFRRTGSKCGRQYHVRTVCGKGSRTRRPSCAYARCAYHGRQHNAEVCSVRRCVDFLESRVFHESGAPCVHRGDALLRRIGVALHLFDVRSRPDIRNLPSASSAAARQVMVFACLFCAEMG